MNTQKEKEIEAKRARIYDFVIEVVNVVKELPNTLCGNRIGAQRLDAGTSIGANFEEAIAAVSFAAFTYKLATEEKEASETNDGLRVIFLRTDSPKIRRQQSKKNPPRLRKA